MIEALERAEAAHAEWTAASTAATREAARLDVSLDEVADMAELDYLRSEATRATCDAVTSWSLIDRPADLADRIHALPDADRWMTEVVADPETAASFDSIVSRLWRPESVAALAANPPAPATFLIRRLWPADAYGVIGAESKAGKTWIGTHIAISVAAGVSTLDGIEIDRSGPVVMFLGEGGRRNAWRRVRAICESEGIDPATLDDLHLVYRSPKFSDAAARDAIEVEVQRIAPVLIVVDPLYLSAAGANGASLYDMASTLHDIQTIAEDHRCALVLVHHWNQTGKGSGFGRMSGAGPEEWARVLWSIEVNERLASEHTDGSLVRLTVRVRGGEIPDGAFSLTREVWTDDPDDLNSPMHYRVERGEAVTGDGSGRKMNARDRVLAVLTRNPGIWLTPADVQDIDADWSHGQPNYDPIRIDTTGRALSAIAEAGKCERDGSPAPIGYRYRVVEDCG